MASSTYKTFVIKGVDQVLTVLKLMCQLWHRITWP